MTEENKCIWKFVVEENCLEQLLMSDEGYKECDKCDGYKIDKVCYMPIGKYLIQ